MINFIRRKTKGINTKTLLAAVCAILVVFFCCYAGGGRLSKAELVVLAWFGFAWAICTVTRRMWRKTVIDLYKKVMEALEEVSKDREDV